MSLMLIMASALFATSQKLYKALTRWGLVPIYASLIETIVGLDNGLSPVRYQAIIWTNAGVMLIEHKSLTEIS